MFLMAFFDFDNVSADTLFSGTKSVKSANCVVQGCHGANIACGQPSGFMCTMDYKLGDGCRTLANCATVKVSGAVAGKCVLLNKVVIDKCAFCVQSNCYNKGGLGAESCEQLCIKAALGK